MADPISFTIAMVAQVGIGFLFPAEGPRLKDLKISASTYGAAIPEVFGTCRVPGNMIWADKIREHKRKRMVGKGGFYNQYTYTCTFAMGLCKGPINRVIKMWANGKLIYDATDASEVTQDKKYRFKFYSGSEVQVPDSSVVEILGEDNTPAFRGLAYVLFDDMPLEDFGNQIPQITVEVLRNAQAPQVAIGPNYTAFPEPNPLDTYQTDTIMVDPIRGYFYVIGINDDISISDGYANIRRVRIQDGEEDFQTNAGAIKYASQLMGASPTTGNIVIVEGVANNVPWFIVDGITFEEVARYGVSGSFGGSDQPEVSNHMVFSVVSPDGLATREWGITVGVNGIWQTVQTAQNGRSMLHDYQQIGSNTPGSNRGHITFTGIDTKERPLFYGWMGGDATGGYVPRLVLYKYTTGLVTPNVDGSFHYEWLVTEEFEYPNPVAEVPGINIGFSAGTCIYDLADGGLFLSWQQDGGQNWCGKFNLDIGEFTWKKFIGTGRGLPERLQGDSRLNGRIMFASADITNRMYILDTITGDFVTDVDDIYWQFEDPMEVPADALLPENDADAAGIPYGGVSTTFPWATMFFDYQRDSLIGSGFGGRLGRRVRPVYNPQPTTLDKVVESILRDGGLGVNEMDMSRLATQQVRGFGWANGSDIKSVLDQLRMIYLFDIVESNGKLVGIMRDVGSNEDFPNQPVRKVQQKVLGSSNADEMDFWPETRLQDADLPSRVTLTYMNWDNDFQNSTAVAKRIAEPRPTMFSRQQLSMEVNVVFTGTEAKNQVHKLLWAQWSERVKHATRLPWSYIDLDPADVVKVEMDDGRTYEDRLTSMEFGADFALAVESFSRDGGSYEADLTGDAGSSSGSDPIYLPRRALAFIANTPLLRDRDDSGGSYSVYYSGVGNSSPDGWQGASLYKSKNNLDYDVLYGTDNEATWGSVYGIVPEASHGHFALDWETRITIFAGPASFELESITDDELWAGQNLCLIGDELLQFRDCIDNGNGTWTIWNLLRGRRGTEYATGTHAAGEQFLLLDVDTIQGEGELLDARGQSRFFKAVGQGMLLDDSPLTQIVYEPRDLMPYAPKDIRRDLDTGDSITVSWKRRTRKGGNMQDGTGEVPLHETTEKYEFYVLSEAFDGDLTRGNTVPLDNVIFQAETTTAEISFNVSELAAPFDVNLDTLHVLIYQISATVGRGFPGVRSIEPWRVF